MCEPVSEHDSRKTGWYCCRCNSYNPEKRERCQHCFKRRHK